MANTDDFDFGFSAVSEDELKALEKQLSEQVAQKDTEIELLSKTYEEKLNTLYKMVMPLLKNLARDADKDYIFWPDRQKKMVEFIAKVEKVVNG
jgi:hypothetical protein